jgi:hypothetical protein
MTSRVCRADISPLYLYYFSVNEQMDASMPFYSPLFLLCCASRVVQHRWPRLGSRSVQNRTERARARESLPFFVEGRSPDGLTTGEVESKNEGKYLRISEIMPSDTTVDPPAAIGSGECGVVRLDRVNVT